MHENNVEEELIITPSTRQDMPQVIQKILENEKELKDKSNNKSEKMDMWTPAIESEFQAQVDSLANQLAAAMETAISADFRVAKPSELIKMVQKLFILLIIIGCLGVVRGSKPNPYTSIWSRILFSFYSS